MDDASVELQSGSFSDATCQRLTQLLLRCVSLEDKSNMLVPWKLPPRGGGGEGNEPVGPPWAVEELQELARSDAIFAQWCAAHVPTLANTLSGGTRGGNSLRCAALAYDLPRQLLQVRSWQNGKTTDRDIASEEAQSQSSSMPHAAHARSASILLDAANLAIRLHGVESQFTRELELRFQQALYNFAYGLSHELNNPLANIATRAGVLAQDETSKQRLSLLHSIVDNAMRGCEMLGDLMLVARPSTIKRQPVVILPFLEAFVEKGRKWVEPRGVTLELQTEQLPAHSAAQFDPTALAEALWVLVRNGVEAMPMGGRLSICTSHRADLSNRADTSCRVDKADEVRSAAWWVIEVEDEGAGMSPQALHHCFDPYYSGREAGRGLGIGLTKAQRLVALHHGRLTLANRTDRLGCRAVVELPIAE